MYRHARIQDRTLTALKCGSWLHWQYSPAQRREWIDVQCARKQAARRSFVLKRDWLRIAPALGLLIAWLLVVAPGSRWLKLLYMGFVFATLIATWILISWIERRAPGKKLRVSRTKAAPTPNEAFSGYTS
jgi:hypothetical protein